MNEEFTCQAKVIWRGKELHLNKILAQINLDEITPEEFIPPNPTPHDLYAINVRDERRRRFVDLISAEFAHALTEALFKMPDDRA